MIFYFSDPLGCIKVKKKKQANNFLPFKKQTKRSPKSTYVTNFLVFDLLTFELLIKNKK